MYEAPLSLRKFSPANCKGKGSDTQHAYKAYKLHSMARVSIVLYEGTTASYVTCATACGNIAKLLPIAIAGLPCY